MIAYLAPIDHDPHRLAVTAYHHEVEGAVKVSFSKASVRGSGSCPSLNRIASTLPFGLTAHRMQGCFIPILMQWLNAF